MGRRAVKFNACDRCPLGHELPATVTVQFSIGDTRYEIDLCERHHADLDRDISSWGMLGREVTAAPSRSVFGEDYRYDVQRLAHLRGQQSRQDRAESSVVAGMANLETAMEAQTNGKGLPLDADDYQFTVHARERLIERKITVPAALWAASSPDRITPGDGGAEIRVRQGTKVIIDPRSQKILTVATVDSSMEGHPNGNRNQNHS